MDSWYEEVSGSGRGVREAFSPPKNRLVLLESKRIINDWQSLSSNSYTAFFVLLVTV